jgi:glucokinase
MELVADVGGTKTLMGVADGGVPHHVLRYDNAAAPDFIALLQRFLDEVPDDLRRAIGHACIAVAGPVTGGDARLTNRPTWRFGTAQLAALLGGIEVTLLNDFEAAAWGLGGLEDEDCVRLQSGAPLPGAPRLCLGPGTGFGVAALAGAQVLGSEGGHTAFAPQDGQQADLWRFLGGEHRRLTVERLCSGPGLLALYRYSLVRGGLPLPAELEPGEVVLRAREAQEPAARQALALFVRILGAAAGDLAMVFLARGGVYLAGGMPPQLLPELQFEGFIEAFNAKAEHAGLVRSIPVHVVLREDLPLLGAARRAARR